MLAPGCGGDSGAGGADEDLSDPDEDHSDDSESAGSTPSSQESDDPGESDDSTPSDDSTQDDPGSSDEDSDDTGDDDSATSGSEDTGPGTSDDGDGDTSGDDCDDIPDPDQSWITQFQQELLTPLTGESEILPGITLGDRSSSSNRESARTYLASVFEELGIEVTLHDYGSGANVYGSLPANMGGQDPQTVLVGAHYDSVSNCPGANDDGTGVALVMALARQLAAYPCRSRDIAFVLFDEEEKGLVGSKAFASKVSSEDWNIHSVHTVDQMGWDSNGDRLVEIERPGDGLLALYEQAVVDLGVSIEILETDLWATDFSSFQPQYRAMGLTEGYKSGDTTPHYHKSTDKYDTINFEFLKSSTVLVHQVFGDLVYP